MTEERIHKRRLLLRRKGVKKIKPIDKESSVSEEPKKGFYLFPNLLTSASLLCGFYSITASYNGNFLRAAWAVFLALVFDGLDGKVARLTKTTSKFGVQYDSLSDLISFGAAPGILIYNFALKYVFQPSIGFVVAFLYVLCGALRLARFNVQTETADKRYFSGLAIPAGACNLVFTVLFFEEFGWVNTVGHSTTPNLLLIWTLIISLLMVSTFKYWSFKDVDLFRQRPLSTLLLAVIMVALAIEEPYIIGFWFFIGYTLSGPVGAIIRKRKVHRSAMKAPPASGAS